MNQLMGLILISFASMICWEAIRYITPVEIPVRLAPFLVIAVCLIWTMYLNLGIIFAFAGAAGVALMNRLTGAEGIAPWTLPDFSVMGLNNKTKKRISNIKKVPDLPPSIGRRIQGL